MGPIIIQALSDTHGKHREVKLEPCDILIHAGDITQFNKREHYDDFFEWFSSREAFHHVLVGGNHDAYMERDAMTNEYLLQYPKVNYLEHRGINLMGLNIWGSPFQPPVFKMAYARSRAQLEHEWSKMNGPIDILVTHCPPYGVLDKNVEGENTGCDVLLKAMQRVGPKVCLFGHIHEAYGVVRKDLGTSDCILANCSVVDRSRSVVNQPWLMKLENGQVMVR